MSFTRIAAPVSGRLGAINISTGSLVQPTAATPMVTVTRLDPIEVSFALPQRQLGDALAALQSGRAAAEIALGDGAAKKQPPRHGTLSFVDSTVDAATGTVKVKARFDNADQALWPGAFVDVKFAARTLPDAVTVPQAALIAGEDGVSLYTIDDQGLARKQKVQRVAAVGDEAVVQGLDAGQRVVVDGKQNVTPGAKVSERTAEAGKARPAAQAASAAGKPQDPA
jgi:RND family efflux transporter MFP subunit